METGSVAEIQEVELGVHIGGALTFLAQMYGNLETAVREFVQNALDKGAKRIAIVVDRNQQKLQVYDNGRGASREEIVHKLGTFAKTNKSVGNKGEKGIGFLAGLAVGHSHSIITSPLGKEGQYFRATLSRKNISGMAKPTATFEDGIEIHAGLKHGDERFVTVVSVKSIPKSVLKGVTDEDIIEEIQDTFNDDIKEGVRIIVNNKQVGPKEFPGVKQEVIEVVRGERRVIFQLSCTFDHKPKPELYIVLTRNQNYSIPGMPSLKGFSLLSSGHIHGTIRINFCTANADRSGLTNDVDKDFLFGILAEFEKEHADWLSDLKTTKRSQEFEKVLKAGLKQVELAIKSKGFELPDVFAGVVSEHHVRAQFGKPETAVVKLVERSSERPTEKDKREMTPPLVHRPSILHGGVKTHGTRQRRLRGELGIIVDYEPHPHEIWRAMFRDGAVVVNSAHPDWVNVVGTSEKEAIKYATLLISMVVSFEAFLADVSIGMRKVERKKLIKVFDTFFSLAV